jgi:hypothetical protein
VGLDGKLVRAEHGPTSAGSKLDPVIVTEVLTGPKVGLSVIVGGITVNVVDAESPPGEPETVTVYEPKFAEVLTLNEPAT